MNQNNFIFLSEILGLTCIDAVSGKKIGTLSDLSAHFRDSYPRVTGMIIKTGLTTKVLIRWESIQSFSFNKKKIFLNLAESSFQPVNSISEDEELIRDIFYDKQIISVSGSKVVRVNDIHLLNDGSKMWIVHFDVGFKGLLRRLGFEKVFSIAVNFFFSYSLSDTFIRWKDSQLAMEANAYGEYELRIPVNRLSEMHPADLADILAELGIEDRTRIFCSLDPATAAVTLQEVPKNLRVQIAKTIEVSQFALIIEAMHKDEAADLLEHLSKDFRTDLFRYLHAETAVELMELMNYSIRSAGSIMNTEYAAIHDNLNVKEALEVIKNESCRIESLHYIYVTDKNGVLKGAVSLKDLICANESSSILSLMKKKCC